MARVEGGCSESTGPQRRRPLPLRPRHAQMALPRPSLVSVLRRREPPLTHGCSRV